MQLKKITASNHYWSANLNAYMGYLCDWAREKQAPCIHYGFSPLNKCVIALGKF